MKIQNTPYPHEGDVGIASMSITYYQDNDTNDENKNGQYLTVESQPVDNGFFLTIETERWAIDSPDEIAEILEDFKRRLQSAQEKKQKK